MINRKNTTYVFRNRKKLKDKDNLGKIYINENLTEDTKRILEKARELKKKELIHSCWTFNGKVNMKIKENDRKVVKITHICDFENHFSLSKLSWD